MTDGQYRIVGQLLQTVGIAIAIVFAVAEYSHRPPILPSIAFGRAARKVIQYAARKVIHLRAVHSTWFCLLADSASRPGPASAHRVLRGCMPRVRA